MSCLLGPGAPLALINHVHVRKENSLQRKRKEKLNCEQMKPDQLPDLRVSKEILDGGSITCMHAVSNLSMHVDPDASMHAVNVACMHTVSIASMHANPDATCTLLALHLCKLTPMQARKLSTLHACALLALHLCMLIPMQACTLLILHVCMLTLMQACMLLPLYPCTLPLTLHPAGLQRDTRQWEQHQLGGHSRASERQEAGARNHRVANAEPPAVQGV